MLPNLDGLAAITSLGTNLTITENAVLTDLSGLSNLTTVARDLSIDNNDALCQSDAQAFAAGITVGGESFVAFNSSCK